MSNYVHSPHRGRAVTRPLPTWVRFWSWSTTTNRLGAPIGLEVQLANASFDLVLLAQVCHLLGESRLRALFDHVRSAAEVGGRIAILDRLRRNRLQSRDGAVHDLSLFAAAPLCWGPGPLHFASWLYRPTVPLRGKGPSPPLRSNYRATKLNGQSRYFNLGCQRRPPASPQAGALTSF